MKSDLDKDLERIKDVVNQVKLPDELDDRIEDAISRGKAKKVKDGNMTRNGLIAACLVIGMIIPLNMSDGFAQSVYKLPLIGQLARLVTVSSYDSETDTSIQMVTIPNVVDAENTVVEGFINKMVEEKVDLLLKEQTILDAEYKQAYIETGGSEETYNKVETTIDYKIHYVSSNMISFEIFKYQTLAPAYNENIYYNIDLRTGKDISIKRVLGSDFEKIVKEKVEADMLDRMAKSDEVYDVEYMKEIDLTEDRSYYVDENGKVFFVFPKYEVAAGFMGAQFFEVGNIENVNFPDEVTIIGEEIYNEIGQFIKYENGKMTIKIKDQILELETMMSYDYEKNKELKIKYVLEDGVKPVLLQCYPTSNNMTLTVENLKEEEGLIIIEGEAQDGKIYVTSIDPGVKVIAKDNQLTTGMKLYVEYGEIDGDRVWAYLIKFLY